MNNSRMPLDRRNFPERMMNSIKGQDSCEHAEYGCKQGHPQFSIGYNNPVQRKTGGDWAPTPWGRRGGKLATPLMGIHLRDCSLQTSNKNTLMLLGVGLSVSSRRFSSGKDIHPCMAGYGGRGEIRHVVLISCPRAVAASSLARFLPEAPKRQD